MKKIVFVLVIGLVSASALASEIESASATQENRAQACQAAKDAVSMIARSGGKHVEGYSQCDCSQVSPNNPSKSWWTCTVDGRVEKDDR